MNDDESWKIAAIGGGAMFAISAYTSATLLRRSRSKNPEFVRLNCWFCNGDFDIEYFKANSWHCPGCEQYNGFSEDGGYNRDLRTSELRPIRYAESNNVTRQTSDLCRNCELNRCLKVSQLSSFVPKEEKNFDEEVEAFEAHLERVYRLCRRCEATLHQKLGEQDSKLRPNLLSWRLESNRFSARKPGGSNYLTHPQPRASPQKRAFITLLSLGLPISTESTIPFGLLTLILFLSYNRGGLLRLIRHKIVVISWMACFAAVALKEYYISFPEAQSTRIILGALCSIFTICVWNYTVPKPKKKKRFDSKTQNKLKGPFIENVEELKEWNSSTFVSSTPAPSIISSSRASSIFNTKEEEVTLDNSRCDISSLSIEDNVETEFTLMGSNPPREKSSPPFIIKKYNELYDNSEVNFGPDHSLLRRRKLIRPATLSPPYSTPDSPSKAVAKSSWVAGGYWHPKDRLDSGAPGTTVSRSSSQSSGFISYNGETPNLRVIRNTFGNSLPPEEKDSRLTPFEPQRRFASSPDRYFSEERSFCYGPQDSSSSVGSVSPRGWNSSPTPKENTSIMEKEFTLRFSCYSLILGTSILSNLFLMGFLLYRYVS